MKLLEDLTSCCLDGVPLYAPFRANTGEPFTYEELKTNVVYRGSEAVREFFGLNYEDVDHIIFESNYAFEDPIKDEIIDHINHVIDRVTSVHKTLTICYLAQLLHWIKKSVSSL